MIVRRALPTWVRNMATATQVEKKEEEQVMVMPKTEEGEEDMIKKVTVTLLGCDNLLGKITALSLKIYGKDIKQVKLWDHNATMRGVAMELSHIPTATKMSAYVGKGQLQMALRQTDLVMIMGGNSGFPRESTPDLFTRNSPHLREMANAILSHAPKAMIGVCVPPVMPCLSMFASMQQTQGVFCPNSVFGVMALDEMRAATLAAVKLGLPPGTVKIQLIGGATADTIVPIMSTAQPGGDYLKGEIIELMNILRTMTYNANTAPNISGGHATAKFILNLVKGMCREEPVGLSAAVMTGALPGVSYLTLPLKVGSNGVVGSTIIPRLSNMELKALIRALPIILEHIAMGEAAAAHRGDYGTDDLLDLYQ